MPAFILIVIAAVVVAAFWRTILKIVIAAIVIGIATCSSPACSKSCTA